MTLTEIPGISMPGRWKRKPIPLVQFSEAKSTSLVDLKVGNSIHVQVLLKCTILTQTRGPVSRAQESQHGHLVLSALKETCLCLAGGVDI